MLGRNRRALLAAGIALGAALLLDRWAYAHLAYRGVYEQDWGRLLRVVGYFPTWLVVAAALWLEDRGRVVVERPRLSRPLLMLLAPGLGGIAAEVLKLLIRRDRPGLHQGAYLFRPWSEHPFSTRDFGLPSSHTLVAFAGAAIMARIFPRTAPIWYFLAAGCGLTRVLAQAHFLSDVVLGACVGIGIATLLWHRMSRRHSVAPGTLVPGP